MARKPNLEADTLAQLNAARRQMREINQLIFAKGAPLASPAYWRIREIAAQYEKKQGDE